ATQLLGEEGLEDEVRLQCVQTIATGLKKAGLIVDNLLSLGKPRAQIQRERLALETVLSEAVDAVASHPNYRNVQIKHQLPADALFVVGNHDMLVQVFYNVITNALNEMPEGGRILIRGEEDEVQVRIRISDTGPGVSDEQLKHLFDPFFSASSSGGGTGLGLTLSYFIMKEHGGNIEVESVPGKGATFILCFPIEVGL
ncbi:MAG: HAMP domain-containing histidine kinase, partial [Bacteroidetes bacterium]|nr:HAMP domain-containing histidine kinase [Bacteroidota bacterium]